MFPDTLSTFLNKSSFTPHILPYIVQGKLPYNFVN